MSSNPGRRRLAGLGWAVLVAAVLAVGFAWLADWRLVVVETSSMEPTVPENSLAVVTPVSRRAVRAGNVIRFREPADRRNAVLHRVVRVVEQGDTVAFQTQGDANNAPDGLLVSGGDVTGRLRFHVPRLGSVASALAPPGGLVLLVGGPLLALGVSEWRRSRTKRRDAPPAAGPVEAGSGSAMRAASALAD